MGLGLAEQAAAKIPLLPAALAEHLTKNGNCLGVFPAWRLFTFPTKQHWRDPARLDLIERAAYDLHWELVDRKSVVVLVPKVGCGTNTGQLNWTRQVKPLLTRIWEQELAAGTIVLVE